MVPWAQQAVASLLHRAGRYDEAVDTARHAIDLGDANAYAPLAWSLAALGRGEEAGPALIKAYELSFPERAAPVAAGFAEGGFDGAIRASLEHPVDCATAPPFIATARASGYGYLGATEAMYACLEDIPRPLAAFFSMPNFKPYLADPRFLAVVRKVNLEDYLLDRPDR